MDPASLADLYTLLHLNERPYKAAISDGTAVKVNGLNDDNVFTKRYINDPSLAQIRLRHDDLIQWSWVDIWLRNPDLTAR